MKKLHHIVLVLALAATLFTGCTKDEGVTPRPPVPETADQTIMFLSLIHISEPTRPY